MQAVSSRIWTCVTVSISYDDNHYTKGTSNTNSAIYAWKWLVSSRIWTRVTVSISNDDNHFTKGTSNTMSAIYAWKWFEKQPVKIELLK